MSKIYCVILAVVIATAQSIVFSQQETDAGARGSKQLDQGKQREFNPTADAK